MKSKYEISVWSDIYDNDLGRFREQKEIIIGSNIMTSEARARNPKLVNNINGTNQFTFDMYYRYIDNQTGEEVENPYIKYLINERKIKVFWKDEWYDLLIKQIKEDQAGRVFSYTCEDCYVTELSRTGFELTFSTELQNNIGTAEELIEKVIENTDWRYDKDGSDSIYQITDEPVYFTSIDNDFDAWPCPNGDKVTIKAGLPILLYYSCAVNLDDIQTKIKDDKALQKIQFYYTGSNKIEHDDNDMLVTNGHCYYCNITWKIIGNSAVAYIGDFSVFSINFNFGISKDYRAERYIQSQKSVYSAILNRYVNVYKYTVDGETKDIYGYNTTEYNDALSVVNLVTNSSNFKNTSGWKRQDTGTIYHKLWPSFNETTITADYNSKSYLYIPKGITFNSGIANNKAYLEKGFTVGERYIFRIKMLTGFSETGEPVDNNYVNSSKYDRITPSIEGHAPTIYTPNGLKYFDIVSKKYDSKTHWNEYVMECIQSCAYENLNSATNPFGIFLTTTSNYWLEDIQFYREVFGTINENDKIRINPNELSIQSIAQQYWQYFDSEQPPDTNKDNLSYLHTSLDEWPSAIPVYNDYQKYGTIEADNSNRFNILQSIAETFQCWVRFYVKHNPVTGYIEYKNNLPCKYIQLKTELGKETGIGFIYGVDLKDVTRQIKSDKISTKTIVEQNENEFGQNGFCTIARSKLNYTRENFIYNFDYYIQHGLLDKTSVYNDLYYIDGYYSQLYSNNCRFARNLEDLTNKKSEYTKQNAMYTVYNQYVLATQEEVNSINESLIKLAGTENYEKENQQLAQAFIYAEQHRDDIKVQTLIADRNLQLENLRIYTNLHEQLRLSLENLNTSIDKLNKDQDLIIDTLRNLNRNFYIKYSRFIQEGTWTSEDYWDDDLYYLDALQVAYESSRPQISYEINVLRLSDLDEYSSKQYNLGDISFIQDVKYFGYQEDGITPYKEKVVLTEITSYFDTPDKDIIKVQNYKNQFDDLFQRITASVQNLEFTQGKYAKAANIVADDGTIRSTVIQNTFNENKDLIYGAQNESATIDNTGITVIDNGNAAKQVKITSGGVFVTADGGETWKNAIRGDGISTDLLTAGKINTENITVYNGQHPSFRWDSTGLNAYKFNEKKGVPESGKVDTTQFIRVDQYGLYGMQGADPVFVPKNEDDVYNNANFGLTWNRFFLKNKTNKKYIEISTDKDIVINDDGVDRVKIGRVDGTEKESYGIRIKGIETENDKKVVKTVFECGHLYDDDTGKYVEKAYIAGWRFYSDRLESTTSGQQKIQIRADGNIGCYGNKEITRSETVYKVTTKQDIKATGLNTKSNPTIPNGSTIYIFTSSVGKTKTSKQVQGKKQNKYLTPTSSDKPNPPNTIQIVYGSYNYEIDDIVWQIKLKEATGKPNEVGTGDDGKPYYITTYTYTFDLIAWTSYDKTNGYSGHKFTISYDIPTATKNKYTPASNTTWCINNEGKAIFHNIVADGGSIAGWWIDNLGIYQTYNGKQDRGDSNKNVKTELSSSGTAKGTDGIDYTILTDAISAAMATLGGVLLSNGLVNGYDIAQVANTASYASGQAKKANDDIKTLNEAITTVADAIDALANTYNTHTHGIGTTSLTVQDGKTYMIPKTTTGTPK